jgi:hypothetical protein
MALRYALMHFREGTPKSRLFGSAIVQADFCGEVLDFELGSPRTESLPARPKYRRPSACCRAGFAACLGSMMTPYATAADCSTVLCLNRSPNSRVTILWITCFVVVLHLLVSPTSKASCKGSIPYLPPSLK